MIATALIQRAWRGNRWRIAGWGLAAVSLLLPLVAMQFTPEVNWDETDFAVAGGLIVSVGVAYELAARATNDAAYRAAVGLGLAAAFILVWVNLAVGVIGAEDDPANLLFTVVLVVAIIGTAIARFQAHGMARALIATALAQALAGVIALVVGLGDAVPTWPANILAPSGFFTALWLASALLFRRAALKQMPAQ